jgi:asparagine synthase (glutamine-hydrolysing)
MSIAWGEAAEPNSFRLLFNCGAWVTLSQRMGVAQAEFSDWEPITQLLYYTFTKQ